MKKLVTIMVAVLALFALVASPVAAQTDLATVTLWAGQDINAGSVAVAVDGDTLSVTFQSVDGWQVVETHLYAASVAPTKSAPGKFPFQHEGLVEATTDSYTLSLAELGLDPAGSVFLAAHAVLTRPALDEAGNQIMDESGNPVYETETAWGEGLPIAGHNWAMYFEVALTPVIQ